ncbi:FadR/GntR family transcriptional regulator [Metapseudomonas otitidis]|uniref:FadR/GntR family transcriptional regulator n=1 Tax=Metapseudomonas otitidis TaxID=319939 RepID=UPI001F237811|nr:FCD domain-containing protein [Pseudomonas otitidis]
MSTTLVGSVVQSLREAIEQGRWPAGEMLPGQRELADQLGVSRPCLREAVTVLETLGMVRSLPGKGVQVLAREAVDVAEPRVAAGHRMADILELRYALEPFIVGLVAQSIASADLDRLRLRLLDLRDAAEDGALDAFVEAYLGFHRLLGSLTSNPIFQHLVGQAGDALARSDVLLRQGADQLEARVCEHEALVQAIRRRDSVLAADLMRQHLANEARRLDLPLQLPESPMSASKA